jgi:hypothetical protein
MSEGLKIALTAVAGITVFVLGQIIQKWVVEPIQEQRRAIGELIYQLAYYCSQHEGYSFDLQKEARQKFRACTSQLIQSTATIPVYRFFSLLHLVPSLSTIADVTLNMIKLADNVNYETLGTIPEVIQNQLKRTVFDKSLTYSRTERD